MSARQTGPYDSIARKWLALAERRRTFLIALRDSGHWQYYHYSGEAELEAQLREIDVVCERLARIAGPEPTVAVEAVAAAA